MKLLPSGYCHVVSHLPNAILLETSRPDRENRHSYLFLNPVRLLKAEVLEEIPELFCKIEDCLGKGWFVAGFMSYECGYHFEPAVSKCPPKGLPLPLACFGVYERPFVFSHDSGRFESGFLPPGQDLTHPDLEISGPPLSDYRAGMGWAEYCAKVEAIRDYIAAGDVYQVNLTNRILFDFSGSAAALFDSLRNRQKVPYAAFLHLDGWDILSFSPELFLRIKNGSVVTRPMKGTAPRGRNLEEDSQLRKWLQQDPKNRSENVMIVDLLRSDLGRVAEVGSVKWDELFAVEQYETLFQMTSTVSGTLRAGTTLYEVFRAFFPSGSVTGAPKIRAMQIIQELENAPRGVYTGAIGYFAPNHDAVFNVAIRTIALNGNSGELGVGSGIVFDSIASEEAKECQLKAGFLTVPQASFQLLESLLWDGGYRLLDLHLERLRSSADYFGFAFSEADVLAALQRHQIYLQAGLGCKVRLLLSSGGTVSIENVPLSPLSGRSTIILSPHRVSSLDRFLYHKTTCRDLYERLLAAARQQGHEDVIFMNERDEITEGANNNIFVEMNNRLLTPPVESGLLPGVFRKHILENEPRAEERILYLEDLRTADAIFLCNSVRGIRRVTLKDLAEANE